MKKPLLLLLLPFFIINSAFMLMGGCFSKGTYCKEYNTPSITAWNNADSTPRLADANGVLAEAFYLEIDFNDTVYSCSFVPTNPFITKTYAFKRAYNYLREEKLDSYSIISNHDFDATHPAGASLRDVFSKPQYDRYYLIQKPADTGTHTFSVMLFVKDPDKTLIASTSPVKLLL